MRFDAIEKMTATASVAVCGGAYLAFTYFHASCSNHDWQGHRQRPTSFHYSEYAYSRIYGWHWKIMG